MKHFIYIILAGFYLHGAYAQAPPEEVFIPSCDNYIKISGETNVNNFNLHQVVPQGEICAPGEAGWIHFPGSSVYEIRIPVKNFRANNHFVYQDFLDLVKASQFPYIHIHINNTQFRKFYSSPDAHYAQVFISIAGVTKSVPIECIVQECHYGDKIIIGNKTLKLTDFKLDPPVKSFGLIKVKNELNINFEFKMPGDLISKISDN